MMIRSIISILSLTFFFASCKQKEVFYTPEEAMRIADSATQKEIERMEKEAAINLEFRKRVENPYHFGVRTGSPVKNPYDTTGYMKPSTDINVDTNLNQSDTSVQNSANEKRIDPRLRKMENNTVN